MDERELAEILKDKGVELYGVLLYYLKSNDSFNEEKASFHKRLYSLEKESHMAPLRIGIAGAQFAACLHVENYCPLRGSKVEITAVASRTKGGAEELARKYNVAYVASDYWTLLDRKDVDAVDLCVPTGLRHEFLIQAAQVNGYFGKDRSEDLVGQAVDRKTMLREALANCEKVSLAIRKNKVQFCCAENWVYARPVTKLKKLMRVSRGTVMDIRAEESHSGSHAGREPVSGIDLAMETVKAEKGMRVELDKSFL